MSEAYFKTADALGAAIKARSADLVSAVYDDDIVVWHASTRTSAGKAENVGLLAALFKITSSLEYTNVRRHAIEGGVLEQHQLVGTFADGTPMPILEIAIVLKIRNGLITHVEEYFDGQTYAEVWARIDKLLKSA
jgi:ketosteroid isomerase-like protein